MAVFGPVHLLILAAIAATAAGLAKASRESAAAGRAIRLSLGWLLILNELGWYGFRYSQEGFRFPEGLPLQLCDIAVWLTAWACLRLNALVAEFVYFAGLGASAMALLTPDLWAPAASYPTVYFFVAHGAVVAAASVLVFGQQVSIRPGSMWRAFGLLNVYAAAIGVFNLVFGTNYFYLREKPASESLLDWFGPWPVYIVVGDVFALAMFGVMALPLRRRAAEPNAVVARARG
jgi:hypothetical integral membrane protein (TIGR02206 family)